MQAVINAVRDFLPHLRCRVVRLMCNNAVTVAYIKNEGDTEQGVDDGHGASTTRVCQVGWAAGWLVCDICQEKTHQVCITVSGRQGGMDRCHVSALGQQEGPIVCVPAIQNGPSSSAEDRSITRNQGDPDRSTTTGSVVVSRVYRSVTRRSNPAVRPGSRSADSRRDGRRGDGDASLQAVKSTRMETGQGPFQGSGAHDVKVPSWLITPVVWIPLGKIRVLL